MAAVKQAGLGHPLFKAKAAISLQCKPDGSGKHCAVIEILLNSRVC
jgi:hypothetical protein